MSSSPGGGKYAPLYQAHARYDAELSELRAIRARKNSSLAQTMRTAALEVTDKGLARAVWATTSVETPRASQALATPPLDKSAVQAAAPEGQVPAPTAQPPTRPGRRTQKPGWAVHGLGPGGNETHIRSGTARGVRYDATKDDKAPNHRNMQWKEADKLFEKKSDQTEKQPEQNRVRSGEKDGGEGIEM